MQTKTSLNNASQTNYRGPITVHNGDGMYAVEYRDRVCLFNARDEQVDTLGYTGKCRFTSNHLAARLMPDGHSTALRVITAGDTYELHESLEARQHFQDLAKGTIGAAIVPRFGTFNE